MKSLITIAAALLVASVSLAQQPKTFCNPLNLDYALRKANNAKQASRHGADPVVVLFKDRYYLFSTWDVPGYRVSDDLVNWTYIPFKSPVVFERTANYTAAAVAEIDGYLYFFELSRNAVKLYRTQDPDSGQWEAVTEIGPYADPCLFVDPVSGRVFVTYGLEKPIHIVELDRKTFQPVEGSDRELMPPLDLTKPIPDGWEICTWDNNPLSPGMRGNKTFNPCREGSWLTYYDHKYYLQYASPGTTVPGYADGCLVSDNVTGPYTYLQQSPISQKDSGFITSAGHSCLFQDRYGNWWRAVTMLIGVHERFERRVGLFPAGFDAEGIPFTRTDTDSPIVVPEGTRDAMGAADVFTDWPVVSYKKSVTVSSSLAGHAAGDAADENIRTWWSAATGDAGEYLQLDLGKDYDLRAIQLNLYEQDCDVTKEPAGPHRFTVAVSSDASAWITVADRSQAAVAAPHTYVQLDTPMRGRYVRVTNVSMPAGGKFAVSDLRVFGFGAGPKPEPITQVSAVRDAGDRRKVTITWTPSPHARGYVVRYGVSPNSLNHHYLVRGHDASALTLYSLNQTPSYYFRVDTLNEAGSTNGTATANTP